jgi:hypothetical protein
VIFAILWTVVLAGALTVILWPAARHGTAEPLALEASVRRHPSSSGRVLPCACAVPSGPGRPVDGDALTMREEDQLAGIQFMAARYPLVAEPVLQQPQQPARETWRP